MSKAETETIGVIESSRSYGLFIMANHAEDMLLESKPDVEVCIRYNGVDVEFTFAEFMNRLGFTI